MFKLAEMNETAVIRKEKGEYCVRSPNNPDWNGGCYKSKGEAEKRLHEVEYFKRQASNVYLSWKIARRFIAKGGVILLPDFKKALDDFKKGDPKPMQEFGKKALAVLFPEGDHNKVAPWYHGLGTAKRNALNSLQKEFRVFDMEASSMSGENNPFIPMWTRRLEALAKNIRTLELASVVTDETRVVKRGGFNIHPMPGISQAQMDEALEALEQAETKLRAKFPQVIYGDLFFSTHLQKGKAAWYVPSEDKFYLDVGAKKRFDDVYTIIHELGHRFDHMFFKNKELRNLFWNLSTRKEYEKIHFDQKLRKEVAEELLTATKARKEGRQIPILSDMTMLWVTTRYTPGADIKSINSEYLAGKIDDSAFLAKVMGHEDINVQTDKLLHGPLAVTKYGQTSPTENFAEAFAHFVLGMKMPEELFAIMEKL